MSRTAENSEILRLRKELVHARSQISDLQEEIEEKHQLYLKAIQERDTYKSKLTNAKDSIGRVEDIVQSKVTLALTKEREELYRLRDENMLFRQRLEMLDQEKTQMADREKQHMDKIKGLTQDLSIFGRTGDNKDLMKRFEAVRDEKDAREREITKLMQQLNELSNKTEDLLAENRTLRKHANIPKNYGVNLEMVKLHDREKIDDFKRIISVLQQDNYTLEEERTRLKHMLKMQSTLYKQDPSERYKNLTKEQIFKVDQYVMRMLAGEADEPADFYKLKKENQNLRAQLEALNTKGFEFVKNQIEFFFKDKGFGDSSKQLDKLMMDNDELKKMIRDLLTKGIASSTIGSDYKPGTQQVGSIGKFRPPVPHMGIDGDVAQGYSYKFETHLDVVDKNGRPGLGETNRYDVACLQLQLQECLELIKRKDENLLAQQNEIESLFKRARDYLLVQDLLYKDYVKMEKDCQEKNSAMEQSLRVARDQLHEEQIKTKNLEQLTAVLQKGDKTSIEARLIELTKQNSLLDVNLLRLTRKYQTLEEQEAMLRREYHNKEADMSEKDRFVQDRINKLKGWKARAIQQLKYLFHKLRMAVPLSEYQNTVRSMETLKHKNADFIDRQQKHYSNISKLETKIRQNLVAEQKQRDIKEVLEDTENELEVVRKRLENLDPDFRWENAIFNKIVSILKRVRVSPQQAFEEFDINKDGKLTRQEFLKALEMMKIYDMTSQDLDRLMSSIDTDSDGYIKYNEFVRKLNRHGVKNRTSEEQIIFLMFDALKKNKIRSLSEAFEIIDKEGRGNISREDFRDLFKGMDLRIDPKDVEKFIDHFWKDKTGGIDYAEFLRIFNRYQVKFEGDGNNKKGRVIAVRTSNNILKLKKDIYMAMEKAFIKQNKRLRDLFSKVDVDHSNEVELDEFTSMFKQMGVKMSSEEVQAIFNSIDFDLSGQVTFPEMQADFDHVISTDIQTLIKEEEDKFNNQAPERDTNKQDQEYSKGMSRGAAGTQNAEMQMTTKIAILESREKQLGRKLETAMRVLRHAEDSQHDTQKAYDALETRWNELTEIYHQQVERIAEMESILSKSINKDEAEKIKNYNERLQTELTETRAALFSYKNMTEVIADQSRGLKLMIERKKDENESLINAVRELQSQTIDQQRLGKLYYVVMLSRWQEAACNKKYDMVLTENKELRKEIFNSDQLYQTKEYEHHECENLLQLKQLELEKCKQAINSSKNIFLTLEKAEQLNGVIEQIADEKSELEEQYFKLRTEFLTNQLMMDEAQIRADHANELLQTLQNKQQSELSDKLIELSDKQAKIRLSELRANREATELKEKHTYISRLHKQQIDQIKKLEEQVADSEGRMHRKEEEFRKIDNERMRRFFYNAKFDDVQGALASDVVNVRKAFKDNSESYNTTRKQDSGTALQRDVSQFGGGASRAFAGGSPSKAGNENDYKLLEGKVKKLQEELKNATDEIKSREAVINRLKSWQLEDKYLSTDEVMKDAIDQHRVKTQSVHEQESKEMAEAALQTITALQNLLDNKNAQLKNKDAFIEKVRKEMMVQKERDGLEISALQQKLSLTAGTTLNKLHEIVVKHESGGATRGTNNHKYDKLSRDEMSKSLEEKDQALRQHENTIRALTDDKTRLAKSKHEMEDLVADLQFELKQQKESNQLHANMKELESLNKQLKLKDEKNKQLAKAIQELGTKMQGYEVQKSDATEENSYLKKAEEVKIKEHLKTIEDLKQRLKLANSRADTNNNELKKMKQQEMETKEAQKKMLLDKDEAQRLLKVKSDRLEQEIRLREKVQIELNQVKGEVQVGRDIKSGLTYEQLQVRVKELEVELLVSRCQQKTVVVYNKESATFEYIGEPILLSQDKELLDIDEILDAMKLWIARNERITVRSIFESLDKERFGEISEDKFVQAMQKIGVKLRPNEVHVFKDYLDTRKIGFLKYMPLVRELQGIPQVDFMKREVLMLAKLAEYKEIDRAAYVSLIDPGHQESMNLTELQDSLKKCKHDNFSISDQEVETIFKHVTKTIKTIGVTISINRLVDKVYSGLDAILIERMKDAIARSLKSLSELFKKHDANKDGKLDYAEFENLLLECQLCLKPPLLERLHMLLDPQKKTSRISYDQLKFYVAGASSGLVSQSQEFNPALERGTSLSAETSNEELNMCKAAARKILSAAQNNLQEILEKFDKHGDGIITREDVMNGFVQLQVKDLNKSELNMLVKHLDKASRGYVSITNVLERLQELATETKEDLVLRRFGIAVKNQGINLGAELQRFDTSRNGSMDKKTFQKAMKQLSLALNDDEIEYLFKVGQSLDQPQYLNIKLFLGKVQQAQKSKPLPSFISQPPKTQTSKLGSSKAGATGNFDNWELEKKYKKKLEALQQQIEDGKKETQAAEKQSKHWQEMANKLERDKNGLQTRLVDQNAKPPRAAQQDSLNQGQLDQIQGLKDQLFYMQDTNSKLEKTIQVELKAELGKVKKEKEKLEEKVRYQLEENKRLEAQVQRMMGKPMDSIAQREEQELWREKKILDMQQELDMKEHELQDLSEQHFQSQEKLLDLKFQKETYDLQYARLQKRITDLEQYKLGSAAFSAVLKNNSEQEARMNEENSASAVTQGGGGPGQSRQNQDSVKLRSKSSKSVAELEMLVEQLKRVIEKQKAESDQLRKQVEQGEQQKEKLRSEKQLRQKVETLEMELHNYEMKDVNLEGQQKTIKKLIETNKLLQEELRKELERYDVLEKKYKDILIKYNIVAKENAKNMETLFSMKTGAQIGNYDEYLRRDENNNNNNSQMKMEPPSKMSGFMQSQSKPKKYQPSPDRQGGERGAGRADQSFDRAFDDIF